MKKTNCRMCKSSNIQKFLDLGFSALSDNFLTFEQLEESETFFPLTVHMCLDCGLCQLGYVVPQNLCLTKTIRMIRLQQRQGEIILQKWVLIFVINLVYNKIHL